MDLEGKNRELQGGNAVRPVRKATIPRFESKSSADPKWFHSELPSALVRRVLLGVLLVLTVAASSLQAAVVPRYEVRGTVRQEFSNAGLPSVTRSFLCRVDGEKWHIELAPGGADLRREIKAGTNVVGFFTLGGNSEIASSDGTNFYMVSKSGTSTTGGSISATPTNRLSIKASAVIGPGNVPFSGWNESCPVIWYAFASFNYFRALQPGAVMFPMHTVSFEDAEAREHLVPGRWELFKEPPYLPRFVQTSNYFNFTTMPTEYELKERTFPNTNVLFQVSATTNHHELTIPTRVSVDTFFHRQEGGSVKSFKGQHFEVSVQKIEELREPVGARPALEVNAKVDDLRYWLSDPAMSVSVITTNGWPGDKTLEENYLKRRARVSGGDGKWPRENALEENHRLPIEREVRERGNTSFFALIALGIGLVPLLIVWWIFWRRKQ